MYTSAYTYINACIYTSALFERYQNKHRSKLKDSFLYEAFEMAGKSYLHISCVFVYLKKHQRFLTRKLYPHSHKIYSCDCIIVAVQYNFFAC